MASSSRQEAVTDTERALVLLFPGFAVLADAARLIDCLSFYFLLDVAS